MLQWLKKSWRELKKSKPGERFKDLNERRASSPHAGLKKAASIAGALVVIGLGVVTYPIPGIPSELVILLGVALLAQGSRSGAKALDWLELRLRGPFLWAYKYWKPLPRWAKVILSLVWMVLLSGAGYGVYRLFSH